MAQGMIAQTVVVGRIELRSVPEQQATVLKEFFLYRPPLAFLQRHPTATNGRFLEVQCPLAISSNAQSSVHT